jgi:oxygen-independent coproporphyrinogen-3 oxidase
MSGIYLHIPFCKQACHYCDFHFSTSLKKKDDIVNAIAMELVLRKDEISSPIETIYFGGGTPSVLSPKELNFLLNTVRENYILIESPEVTLEANPDDLNVLISNTENSESIFKQYKSIGINRLSIGIQSFFSG